MNKHRKPRVSVRSYDWPFCWHIYKDGKYVYCGRDWDETLRIAQDFARTGVLR